MNITLRGLEVVNMDHEVRKIAKLFSQQLMNLPINEDISKNGGNNA